jgi:hypothetical protein
LLLGVVEAMTHFVEDVEVVLDVLKRAVLGEFVQERFDLLFGAGHYHVRIAWRAAKPRSRKGGETWGTRPRTVYGCTDFLDIVPIHPNLPNRGEYDAN